MYINFQMWLDAGCELHSDHQGRGVGVRPLGAGFWRVFFMF